MLNCLATVSSNLGILTIFNCQQSRNLVVFQCKIWFENGANYRLYFFTPPTAPLFFTLAPPRLELPFSVRASGAVALNGAQVPGTAYRDRYRWVPTVVGIL